MGIRQKDTGICAVSENAKKKNNNLQNCSSGISNRQYRFFALLSKIRALETKTYWIDTCIKTQYLSFIKLMS